MKLSTITCSLLLLSSVSLLFAQNPIPNPGFENWSGINPDSWSSTNIQGQVTNVTQTSDAHSGSWAAKGEVVEWMGFPYPPGLLTGFGLPLPFPISQNYESFTGYYKCNVEGEDIGLGIVVNFLDVNFQTVAIGLTGFGESSSFQQFSVVMDYTIGNGNDAAFAAIEFALTSNGNEFAYGSWWIVDDLEFAGVASIERIGGFTPDDFELTQNYPNPFNPSTNIQFSLPEESFVTLKVYNVQGEEVAALVNENLSTGTYSADWSASNMPSGMYIYTLSAGEVFLSKKMLLMK